MYYLSTDKAFVCFVVIYFDISYIGYVKQYFPLNVKKH